MPRSYKKIDILKIELSNSQHAKQIKHTASERGRMSAVRQRKISNETLAAELVRKGYSEEASILYINEYNLSYEKYVEVLAAKQHAEKILQKESELIIHFFNKARHEIIENNLEGVKNQELNPQQSTPATQTIALK